MKSLLFALLCAASLTSATTASAQTTTPPPAAQATPEATPEATATAPKGVTVQYRSATYQSAPVSAELNKYEIRRCRAIGVITAADAHMIRRRKRLAQRQENAYLKAEAAKLGRPEDAALAQR